MTLYEFNMFDEMEQAEILWGRGAYWKEQVVDQVIMEVYTMAHI